MVIDKVGFDFKFDSSKCNECDGNCCIGESGYIWVSIKDIKNLSKFLNISVKEVFDKYIDKIDYKFRAPLKIGNTQNKHYLFLETPFSLKEKFISKNNYRCIFFDLDKKKCKIYDIRPTQCRTYPFWDRFKTHKQEVIKECPAIIDRF